jgi:hypothetical protein
VPESSGLAGCSTGRSWRPLGAGGDGGAGGGRASRLRLGVAVVVAAG